MLGAAGMVKEVGDSATGAINGLTFYVFVSCVDVVGIDVFEPVCPVSEFG